MRVGVALAAVVLAACAASAGVEASSPVPDRGRVVPCGESIDGTRFPFIGGRRPGERYRLVLGTISAPPAYHEQMVRNGTQRWPYFVKSGLVIRSSGQSVVVVVPRDWRNRAAIAWGYGGKGVFQWLRFEGCRALPTQGFAYSGGFFVRSARVCVPLIFRVGRRSETVRFGLGQRCRPLRPS